MLIEVIKKDGHFIVPYFEKIHLNLKRIKLEIDENFLHIQEKDVEKSETYKALEKAVEKSGGNNLLKIKLKNMPKDFCYKSDKTDEEILYDALKGKYEL